MPQYEVETPDETVQVVRARSPEDAASRAGLVAAVDEIDIATDADLQGWRTILAGREVVGRVREHNRMRFRRD